jgi:DNA-binding response OmpR family regulator
MTRKTKTQTVLVIEDDSDIQNFISRVLELEGYRVIKADDGRTGMELIKDNPVSLILLDLRLPGPDGWSILQEIKGNPAISEVPVVVLTAIAESVQQRRTLSMGATKYLIKPLSAHKLSMTVASILHQGSNSHTSIKNVAAVKN